MHIRFSMRILVLGSVLLAAGLSTPSPAFTQEADNNSTRATPTTSPLTLTWSRDAEGMDAILRDGMAYLSITRDGIQVTAAVSDTGWKTRVELAISSLGDQRFDFYPENVSFAMTAPKQKELKYNDPNDLIKSLNRRAAWATALSSLAASTATREEKSTTTTSGSIDVQLREYDTWRSGTSYGKYSETSETTKTVPDEQARQQAADRIASIRATTGDAVAIIASTSLRPNTVLPRHQIVGVIWFDRDKKMTEVVIRVPVAGMVLQFPFRFSRK